MNKQNVLLINLPPSPDYKYMNPGSLYPATGILLIGTILKKQGLNVKIIDGTTKKDYEQKTIEAINDDTIMVGFSVMTSQVPLALNLSKIIKAKHTDIPIVWGGIHPILFPEQTVQNPNIDMVVTGEGYETILDLLEYTTGRINIEQVRGIGYKNKSGVTCLTKPATMDNINELPHFNFDILDDLEIYLNSRSVYEREISKDKNEKTRLMPMLTGLGCCYKCQFCINVILKRKYRFRSAISIIAEIKKLQKKYSTNAFIFYDEDFLISKKRLLEFLDLIEKDNLQFYWRIWGRVNYFRENYLNKDLVLRLERCGLRSIAMGAESGSQEIIDLIEKRIKVENIIDSARMLKPTKITPRYSFIVGLDGEQKKDTKLTYKLCAELMTTNNRTDIAGPFIFRYYPGSPIFDRIISKYNIKIPEKIADWTTALSKEGFLELKEMPWTWNGLEKYIETLNRDILIYDKLRRTNIILGKLINRIIQWRLKKFNINFPIEVYTYDFLKNIYHIAKKINNGLQNARQ